MWGDATDGSLVTEPVEYGEPAPIAGLSTNGRLFNLWGDVNNFNYAKHDDVQCEARPAIIDDWTGFYSGSRGFYCPGVNDNQLWKYTWDSDGGETAKLGWTPAERIGRMYFGSNIYGVSTSGELLVLWDQKNVAVHSARLDLPSLGKVQSVGGSHNNVFACSQRKWIFSLYHPSKLFNVYWDVDWKAKEIILSEYFRKASCFFGSIHGETYLLYGRAAQPGSQHPYYPWYGHNSGKFTLYRIDSVNNPDRFSAVPIQSYIPDPVF